MTTELNYSVIIPHRNTPDLLERCVSSIPDREDIQAIVIDDNSDAQYTAYIKQICAKQKNILFIPTTEGLGAGYARNIGLRQVKSKWVLFADADDYFLSDAWTIFDRHMEDKADIIYFHCTCRYSDTNEPGDRHLQLARKVDAYILTPNDKTEGTLRYNYNESCGKMIRASLIQNHNISFEQTRWANDVHFSTAIGYYAQTIAAEEGEVYCISIARGSLVHQHSIESRRCRYEVILRNNAYLRQMGKSEYQDSLMYSLKWAAKLGGWRAVWDFIRLGRKYNADFTHGATKWITNFFASRNDYKNKENYIIRQ